CGSDTDGESHVGADRAPLVCAVHYLAWSVASQPPPGVSGDAVPARRYRRLLFWQAAPIQKVAEFLGNNRRMDRIFVAGSCLVKLVELVVKLLASGSDLGHPPIVFHGGHGIGQCLERGFLTTDDADIDREVAPDILGARVDPDVFGVGPEREFPNCGHAMLTDEYDYIGARQSRGSSVG